MGGGVLSQRPPPTLRPTGFWRPWPPLRRPPEPRPDRGSREAEAKRRYQGRAGVPEGLTGNKQRGRPGSGGGRARGPVSAAPGGGARPALGRVHLLPPGAHEAREEGAALAVPPSGCSPAGAPLTSGLLRLFGELAQRGGKAGGRRGLGRQRAAAGGAAAGHQGAIERRGGEGADGGGGPGRGGKHP